MDVTEDAHDGLYWRLHTLSKALESSGRIDVHDYPDAYATVLDAMNAMNTLRNQEAFLTAEETALQAWYDCGCGTPELERWKAARRDLATAIRAPSC